jgi:hypothetical protein
MLGASHTLKVAAFTPYVPKPITALDRRVGGYGLRAGAEVFVVILSQF